MTNDEPGYAGGHARATPGSRVLPREVAFRAQRGHATQPGRGIRRSRVGEGQPYTFTAQRYTYPYTKTPANAVYAVVNEVKVDGDRERQPAASAGREQVSAER
jgi:hypothetical protein